MLDFSRNEKKRETIVQNAEKMWRRRRGRKTIPVCAVRLRRGNPLGSTGHFEHVLFLHGGENLGQEATELLQARKSI